jgi:hypothetical protein
MTIHDRHTRIRRRPSTGWLVVTHSPSSNLSFFIAGPLPGEVRAGSPAGSLTASQSPASVAVVDPSSCQGFDLHPSSFRSRSDPQRAVTTMVRRCDRIACPFGRVLGPSGPAAPSWSPDPILGVSGSSASSSGPDSPSTGRRTVLLGAISTGIRKPESTMFTPLQTRGHIDPDEELHESHDRDSQAVGGPHRLSRRRYLCLRILTPRASRKSKQEGLSRGEWF